MENLRNYLIIGLLAFVLGGAITKYYWPTPVNTDKKQVTAVEETKNNIVTVVTEETKPDGTKKVVTTTTDKSEKKESSKSSETKTTVAKAEIFFGGGVVKNVKDFQEKEDYQIIVGKRLAGPVLGFATYQFKGVVSANVVIEF